MSSAASSDFLFPYRLKTTPVRLGEAQLQILSLEDIEQTIDQIYESLSRDNRPELLENLCPYFGVVWAAGAGLAQFLEKESRKPLGDDLGVLEIGCGLALPSLILAQRGVPVWATDQHPDVPIFLRENLKLNPLKAEVHYRVFDWMKTPEPISPPKARSWIVGSDILYERQHPEQVTREAARSAPD
jgi:predicted nicotinamide N-methyase